MFEIETVEPPELVCSENRAPETPAISDDLQAEVNDFIERLVLERDATLFEG